MSATLQQPAGHADLSGERHHGGAKALSDQANVRGMGARCR